MQTTNNKENEEKPIIDVHLSNQHEKSIIIEHQFNQYEEFKPIRILFLFISAAIWPSTKSVWQNCIEDKRFNVKLVLLKNQHGNNTLKVLTDAKNLLIKDGVPFFYENTFSMEKFKPHVVFVPLPYMDMFPNHYSLSEIQRHNFLLYADPIYLAASKIYHFIASCKQYCQSIEITL
ncbi:MAG: hypothetical protein GY821_12225 [Gammaproteobacteria bacterium]|nr:hypothetical protein [Gammaproteobacteria bacterium]